MSKDIVLSDNLEKEMVEDLSKYLGDAKIYGKFLEIYESGSVISEVELKKAGFVIGISEKLLRKKFWEELTFSRTNGYDSLDLFNIYIGICSCNEFIAKMNDVSFCNYLINPMVSYSEKLVYEVEGRSLDFYKEIMDKDLEYGEDSDKKLGFSEWLQLKRFQLQTMKHMENTGGLGAVHRFEGKIQSKSDNRTFISNSADMSIKSLTADELRTRISALDRELSGKKTEIMIEEAQLVDDE